jgi:hypothetical protein
MEIVLGAGVVYFIFWSLRFWCTRQSKGEVLKQCLLTTASLSLVLSILEVLAATRIVDYRLLFATISEPWRHPDNLLDPKLLHIRRPHFRFVYEGIDYSYDRNGLRNEADLESANVVVMGDSMIEGWNVSSTELLTSKLAHELDRTVANIAQSWYGPQQELELLRRYGMRLDPKVCVLTFFEGNDLNDVHRYKTSTDNWAEVSRMLNSFTERSFTKNIVRLVRRINDQWRGVVGGIASKNF